MDVPYTIGNYTPKRQSMCSSSTLDVPYTIGNHTPAFTIANAAPLLDVPYTIGNHTPYTRQMTGLHQYRYLPSGIIPQHKGPQQPQFEYYCYSKLTYFIIIIYLNFAKSILENAFIVDG